MADKNFLDEDGVSQFAEETKKYVDNKVSQLDDKYIRSDDTTIIRLRNQNEINLQEDHNNAWFGYRDGKVTNWKFGDGTEGGLADVYANDYYLGDEKLSETYIRVDDTTIVKLVNDNEINLQEDHQNAWFGYRGGKVTNWKFGDGTEGGLADVYVKDLYLGDEKLSDLLGDKANDADVVHKSGDETISGVKTFSDTTIVAISKTHSSQISADRINGTKTGFSANNGFKIICDKNSDAWNNTAFAIHVPEYSPTNSTVAFKMFDCIEGSTSYRGFLFKKDGDNFQLSPTASKSTDLGSSTKQWKTINGINPGALSLPSLNYIQLDTSSFDTTSTTIGAFAPTVNGWAILSLSQKNKPFGIWILHGSYRATFNSVYHNDTYMIFALIPVMANITMTIYCTSSEIDSTRIIDWLRLFPCQGNV